eukprot:2825351-Prymnesium_polylepis.1
MAVSSMRRPLSKTCGIRRSFGSPDSTFSATRARLVAPADLLAWRGLRESGWRRRPSVACRCACR